MSGEERRGEERMILAFVRMRSAWAGSQETFCLDWGKLIATSTFLDRDSVG